MYHVFNSTQGSLDEFSHIAKLTNRDYHKEVKSGMLYILPHRWNIRKGQSLDTIAPMW